MCRRDSDWVEVYRQQNPFDEAKHVQCYIRRSQANQVFCWKVEDESDSRHGSGIEVVFPTGKVVYDFRGDTERAKALAKRIMEA